MIDLVTRYDDGAGLYQHQIVRGQPARDAAAARGYICAAHWGFPGLGDLEYMQRNLLTCTQSARIRRPRTREADTVGRDDEVCIAFGWRTKKVPGFTMLFRVLNFICLIMSVYCRAYIVSDRLAE